MQYCTAFIINGIIFISFHVIIITIKRNTISLIPGEEPALLTNKTNPLFTNLISNEEEKSYIFSLDIGTRTIIGIVGYYEEDKFHIIGMEKIEHSKRAMLDGQIEDIAQVSNCIETLKKNLENRLQINLTKVSIAAAGRALRTETVTLEQILNPNTVITQELIHNLELECVQLAQRRLMEKSSEFKNFYCVGYSITSYTLDGYHMSTIIDHKGNNCQITIIAAFLPKTVVESLYTTMDNCGLEVANLTLEPIAAMNVIIPPELRKLNLALVDIGAGTSDIAISKDGTVIAYDMVTIAGDEITEAIMQKYLVDFHTAEEIKLYFGLQKSISFADILGFEQKVERTQILEALSPTIDHLVAAVCEKILAINLETPTAVFLVGGGSLFPLLSKAFAQKLGIEDNRVAVGSSAQLKKVVSNFQEVDSPEYVTPIGIAVTSALQSDYGFASVIVNGKSIRQFGFIDLKISDVLILSGDYKYDQLIGRTGKRLRYELNGQAQVVPGGLGTPATILINNQPGLLSTLVSPGDEIQVDSAQQGQDASQKVCELLDNYQELTISLDGVPYEAGTIVTINQKPASANQQIQDGDQITLAQILTLGDLLDTLGIDGTSHDYHAGQTLVGPDYTLNNFDLITTHPKTLAPIEEPAEGPLDESWPQTPIVSVYLNNDRLPLPPKEDGSPYMLFDLLNYIDDAILEDKERVLTFTINGKEQPFTTIINNGDVVKVG